MLYRELFFENPRKLCHVVHLHHEPAPAAHVRDIIFDKSYKYSLNSNNQARRLVTAAQKPPLSFTFNNIQTVNNNHYAHNVNIELNSGVYLSAIKPVLETTL